MPSKESILMMLKTLCEYHNVSIKHEFEEAEEPLMSIRCLDNTTTIEITYYSTEAVELFDSFEDAVKAIQKTISEYLPNRIR